MNLNSYFGSLFYIKFFLWLGGGGLVVILVHQRIKIFYKINKMPVSLNSPKNYFCLKWILNFNKKYNKKITKTGAATRTTQSPDGHLISPSNVLSSAQTLALLLQQTGNMTPSPDSNTAGVISKWLDTHLPVSDLFIFYFTFISFILVYILENVFS